MYKKGHGVPTELSVDLNDCVQYPYRDASEQRNPGDHIHAISDVTFCVRILCRTTRMSAICSTKSPEEKYNVK